MCHKTQKHSAMCCAETPVVPHIMAEKPVNQREVFEPADNYIGKDEQQTIENDMADTPFKKLGMIVS